MIISVVVFGLVLKWAREKMMGILANTEARDRSTLHYWNG